MKVLAGVRDGLPPECDVARDEAVAEVAEGLRPGAGETEHAEPDEDPFHRHEGSR